MSEERCPVCSKSFPNALKLAYHCAPQSDLHSSSAPVASFNSNFTRSSSPSNSNRVSDTHSLPFDCACIICQTKFTTVNDWGKHFIKEHSKYITCPLCKEYLPSDVAHAEHCVSKHRGIPFQCRCKGCDQGFNLASEWGEHFLTVHNGACTFCSKNFESIGSLAAHCVENHKDSLFQLPKPCKICNKVFRSAYEWGRHYLSHPQCPLCIPKKSFSNFGNLARHCITDHPAVQYSCSCKLCDDSFNTASSWGSHFLSHFEESKDEPDLVVVRPQHNKEIQAYQHCLQQLASSQTKLIHLLDHHLHPLPKNNKPSSAHSLTHSWKSLSVDTVPQLLKHHEQYLEELSQTLQRNSEKNLCVVCWENEKVMASVSCGHLLYCEQCSKSMVGKNCAVCRKNAGSYLRVFI